MNIKMIVTDLDNTLLHGDKTISDYTRDVFKRCRERGVHIAFATARYARHFFSGSASYFIERIPIDGLCASNGAHIYADGNAIAIHTYDKATQKAFTKELMAVPEIYRISAKTVDECFFYSHGRQERDDESPYDFPDDCKKEFITMACKCADRKIPFSILNKYSDINYHATTGEDIIDIVPIDATKRNGVLTLAKQWNISPEQISVFGDDYNDIDMLSLPSVVSVAVDNAIDEVKAVASQICGDCDDDGVAKWIEENVI